MSDLLFSGNFSKALLQQVQDSDPDRGLAVLARGIARGQGITEGYHERLVPLSKPAIGFFKRGKYDVLGHLAQRRVQETGDMRGKVLRPALFALLQDGADDINYGSKTTAPQADKWLKAFEHAVDLIFFERLWNEVAADPADRDDVRHTWLRELRDLARAQLTKAERAAPLATMRRYKAITRGRAMFDRQAYKQFSELRPQETDNAAA